MTSTGYLGMQVSQHEAAYVYLEEAATPDKIIPFLCASMQRRDSNFLRPIFEYGEWHHLSAKRDGNIKPPFATTYVKGYGFAYQDAAERIKIASSLHLPLDVNWSYVLDTKGDFHVTNGISQQRVVLSLREIVQFSASSSLAQFGL